MADYIDRKDVVEYLRNSPLIPQNAKGAVVLDVGAIPATDVVERKRGEWIGFPESFKFEHIYDRDAIVCPFCEESWNIVDNDTETFSFCPNCGADLRGDT